MKIEPCEPCEWVGLDVPAEHHVGWDQTPLCEYHFEVDKQGKLGNWVNANVVFDSPEDTPTEAPVVESGGIAMKPMVATYREVRHSMFVKEEYTGEELLRTLENDAWKYLGRSEGGSLASLAIARYLTDFLTEHNVDTSDLETSLSNL